ncbi:MAG: hypothetical protein JXR73_05650 [Candidatus Omnitrophica bacterium]|nr:hypothetical protein [Candidatus Omnitrophota bacterium]
MPDLYELARGPLFRLSFLIMALGLLRLFLLSLFGIVQMVRRARDKNNSYGKILLTTASWMLPVHRLHRHIPLISFSSFLFHAGVIVVPLFLLDHIYLWQASIGIAWPGISRSVADVLTLLTLITGTLLLGFRIFSRSIRQNSGFVDYFLLIVLLLIFATGYIASRPYNPIPYQTVMLIHLLSAEVFLVLTPFTKIAHCILFPLIRLTSELAWKFPPDAGRNVTIQVHGEVKSI